MWVGLSNTPSITVKRSKSRCVNEKSEIFLAKTSSLINTNLMDTKEKKKWTAFVYLTRFPNIKPSTQKKCVLLAKLSRDIYIITLRERISCHHKPWDG